MKKHFFTFHDIESGTLTATTYVAKFLMDQINASDDMIESAHWRMIRDNVRAALSLCEYRVEQMREMMLDDFHACELIERAENYETCTHDLSRVMMDDLTIDAFNALTGHRVTRHEG